MMDRDQIEERTARISQLDSVRLQGVRAAQIMRDMGPVFTELREIYNRQLVANTKELGEADTHTVYSLVALADIEAHLRQQARRGSGAAEKLDKITKAGGSPP